VPVLDIGQGDLGHAIKLNQVNQLNPIHLASLVILSLGS
jgi:hypothetical protein